MSGRLFILIGSLTASISVLAGAFGAHELSEVLGERSDLFETAVRYQMYHSLAIILVGFLVRRYESKAVAVAGWLFLAGILAFCGSLYFLAVTGLTTWVAVTPVGGGLFVLAWLLAGLGVWKSPRKSSPTYFTA